MLFYSYFKTLVGKEVTVELKNDLAIAGTLHSVDQYLNIKLYNIRVINEQLYPHMVSLPVSSKPSLHMFSKVLLMLMLKFAASSHYHSSL